MKFLDRADTYENYLDDLANWITKTWPNKHLHLIGFSMGAMTVVRLLNRLPTRIIQSDLISPAAPLETGGHLQGMAGKAVFKAAMQHHAVITGLSHVQAILCRISPKLFYKLLFSDVTGFDKDLIQDMTFQTIIQATMKQCLTQHRSTYVRETREYVRAWSYLIQTTQTPTRLWHGLKDTWAPHEMSDAIASLLGARANIHKLENHAHYSTLGYAMKQICDLS